MSNKGIHDMVIRFHSEETWGKIKSEVGCEDIMFSIMNAFDDAITYNLIGAASKKSGNTFPKFLSNLDDFHARVGSSYPNLNPPSFIGKEIDKTTLLLAYHLNRNELKIKLKYFN